MDNCGESLHSARTSYSGNSVAARLKQAALKATLADDSLRFSALSPTSVTQYEEERPKRKLSDANKATIRLIAQYLQDIGLTDTARTLAREARCTTENIHAARLREGIRERNWDDAVAIIDASYDHLTERQRDIARNILLEEKFLDLLIKQKRPLALHMLKTDVDPANPMRDRLMKLLFRTDKEIFGRTFTGTPDALAANTYRNTARIFARLQRVLPSSFMLPERRLQTLLGQALEAQAARCETHMHRGVRGEAAMLLEDHKCPKRDEQYFVETCSREDSGRPVRKVAFSPCGLYLATASFATEVVFWKVNAATSKLDLYRRLAVTVPIRPCWSMAWSGDSRLLAVCGGDDNDNVLYVYDMHGANGDCLWTHMSYVETHHYTCVDFFPRLAASGAYQLVVGDVRGGTLRIVTIEQKQALVTACYEGYRVRHVYACRDGRGAYAADTHNRVRWYRNDPHRMSDHTVIREENTITTMAMHPSEQLLLIATRILGLRMWNVKTRSLLRTFHGYHDGGCSLNVSFGGVNNEYIVAGSFAADDYDDEGEVIRRNRHEDVSTEETIRIWRLTDEYLVCGIAGHVSTVNCVAWSPRDPFMIASGSDDQTIRLWSCRAEDRDCAKKGPTADASDEDKDIDETPLRDGDEEEEDKDETSSGSDSEESTDSDSSEGSANNGVNPADFTWNRGGASTSVDWAAFPWNQDRLEEEEDGANLPWNQGPVIQQESEEEEEDEEDEDEDEEEGNYDFQDAEEGEEDEDDEEDRASPNEHYPV